MDKGQAEVSPIRSNVDLLKRRNNRGHVLAVLEDNRLRILILDNRDNGLILHRMIRRTTRINITIIRSNTNIIYSDLANDTILHYSNMLRITSRLLILTTTEYGLHNGYNLADLPDITLLRSNGTSNIITIKRTTFRTIRGLYILMTGLASNTIRADGTIYSINISTIRLHRLIVTRETSTTLSTHREAKNVLLMRTLERDHTNIYATLADYTDTSRVKSMTIRTIITTITTVTIYTPTRSSDGSSGHPRAFITRRSTIIVTTILPDRVTDYGVIRGGAPFDFTLYCPTAIYDKQDRVGTIFIGSTGLEDISLEKVPCQNDIEFEALTD